MNASAYLKADVGALIGRRGPSAVDLLIIAALVDYVGLFLAVRSATNICFFLLVLIAVAYWVQQRAAFAAAWRLDGSRALVAALASVFVAAIVAKLLRGEFGYSHLDGPSRFLLAGLLLMFLIVKRIQFVRVFAFTLPIATLAALAAVLLNPEGIPRWGVRVATSFVDPNTLGSYAVILTFMILLTVDTPDRSSSWRRGLALAGIAAGSLLATFATSRGGWLAVLPLAALWLLFRRSHGVAGLAWLGLVVLAIAAVVVVVVPDVTVRGLGSVAEMRRWLEGSYADQGVAERLGVWKLGLELYAARPLVGYGWPNVSAQFARPEFATAADPQIIRILIHGGPHNDLLTMALSHGVFGIIAFAALLFVPAAFFWRRRRTATGEARLACELGVCLAAGVFICGLVNEMLSLKYLASFYGLTVAGLAAQVLGGTRPASTL